MSPKSTQSTEGRRVISTIHALRGLAALAVLLAHSNYAFFGFVCSQFQGVRIFFVISGFIVAYITEDGTDNFLYRRAVRILPVYWLLTIFAVVWYSLSQFAWLEVLISNPTQAFSQLESLLNTPHVLTTVFRSMVLMPYTDAYSGQYTVFLHVGWTLAIECLYYLLFAIFAMAGRTPAMLAVSAFFIGCNALRMFSDLGGVLAFYGKIESLYIVFGFVVYWLWNKVRHAVFSGQTVGRVKVLATIVGTTLLVSNSISPYLQGVAFTVASFIEFFLPPLVVLCALLLHTSGVRLRSPILRFLGDISYSLYLVHMIVLTTFERYGSAYPILRFKESLLGLALATATSCLIAWLLHIGFEQPVIRAGKRFIRTTRAPLQGAHG